MTRDPSRRHVAAGDIVIRQGEHGDCAYVLENGRVEIIIERPDGRMLSAGIRGPGSLLGEMAVVDQEPRIATMRAVDDCTLLRVTEADFTRRLDSADPVLRLIIQVILERHRDTLKRLEIIGDGSVNLSGSELLNDRLFNPAMALDRLRLAGELRDALHAGQLSLRYQPMVDIVSGDIKGVEALVRWEHPQVGMIVPDRFIPVAEETGLIVDLSAWVLGEACRALNRFDAVSDAEDRLYVSVNFSGEEFAAESFVETVTDTLSRTGVGAGQLCLEITERVLMAEPDRATRTLRSCRDAGICIAIDDFGTGFSSLSYLSAFPIDTLKIDRSFVFDMHESAKSLALVQSIIDVGKNLRMTVIAEGVETSEDANRLAALGCHQAQGYYFGKPLTETEFINVLRRDPPEQATSAT